MDTMNVDLASKALKMSYGGERGSYSLWSPDDLPMLHMASIGDAKLLLRSHGLTAPSYSDSSEVSYVLEGN
jgi:Cupin